MSDLKVGRIEQLTTPGPWALAVNLPTLVQVCGGGVPLAVLSKRKDPQRMLANARLIAAAPDLLAALKRALPFIDDADDVQKFYPDSACSDECRAAVQDIKTALAKAEGRS